MPPTTISPAAVTRAKLTVIGGIGVAVIAVGMWILVFFQVLYTFIDSVDWFPGPVNVVVDVLAVVLPFVALRMLRNGSRTVLELQESVDVEGLTSVVGDLPDQADPTDLEQVTRHLLRLDDLELPYTVEVERDGDRATVTVRWRVEELRWRTLLTRGSQVWRWRMVVQLDARTGTYTFAEYSSWSSLVGSGATASLSGSKGWSRAKTMGAGSVTKVWAAGEVESPEGTGTSGSIRLVPSDAKVPVFHILRAYGWRPRWDSAFWRQWEY